MKLANNSLTKLALSAAIAATLVGCGGDDNDNNSSTKTLSIAPTYLDALGDTQDYEGWLIVNGKPVSTGTFDIVDGQTVPASFSIDENDADQATTFILTIEPEVGDVPAPSAVHIVAGELVNNKANAVANHQAALGTDFADATGAFFLRTPTNGNTTPNQGIWYIDNRADGSNAAGLSLPTLPAGWVYEGWVVGENGPISTGTFLTAEGRDSDGAGPAKGPTDDGPAFPGQDFVDPATVLIDYKAVISVEPNPDNSAAPFSIKPLLNDSIEDTTAVMDMTNISAMNLPSAVVTIK